jgi:hypothetical protein
LLEAIQEADAKAPADLPVGPPMFRYSEDSEFAALLASTGLEQVNVTPHIFTYRVPTADVLWTGVMGSLARTSALLAAQMPDVQRRIRSAFDVLVNAYRSPQGIDVPIAFKTASGRKC